LLFKSACLENESDTYKVMLLFWRTKRRNIDILAIAIFVEFLESLSETLILMIEKFIYI